MTSRPTGLHELAASGIHRGLDAYRHLAGSIRTGAALRLAAATVSLGRGDGVALTFDDGPDPVYTPLVLDVLARHGVNATFFLVGVPACMHPGIVRRIVEEGHAIGSHTRSHPDMWTLSAEEIRREYLDGRAMLEDVSGTEVTLVRPPKGSLGLHGAWTLRRSGLRTVLWSATTDDWRPGSTVESILGATETVVAGDVVLLHDGMQGPGSALSADRSATVAALGPFVDRLPGPGLHPVPLV